MKTIRLESSGTDDIALFLSEGKNGIKLLKTEIYEFSSELSDLYIHLIDTFADDLLLKNGNLIPRESLKILLRNAIVPLAHCFWERALRIQKVIRFNSNVVIAETKTFPNFIFQITEELNERISESKFNEYLLSVLAPIWKLNKANTDEVCGQEKETQSFKTIKNEIFFIGKNKRVINKIIRVLERVLERLFQFEKFPVLTFANAEAALRYKGFYLTHFDRVEEGWNFEPLDKLSAVRNNLFNKNRVKSERFENFLFRFGFSSEDVATSWERFCFFLQQCFPIQSLEGMEINFKKAKSEIDGDYKKYLISSGDGDTRSTFLIAAAKSKGYKIIKAQHGGHYGYLRDISPVIESELPSADIFLSWGWTRMHECKQLEHIKTIPLPSPWLSERKKYWRHVKAGKTEEYDVLWMPQMMKRFNGAPQGGSSIRRDVLEEFSNYMIDFVHKAIENKIKVHAKPYNPTTVSLLSKTYALLKEIGAGYYTCSETFDKGLTRNLIERCKMVLWDQPGTGFLECLSCEIPTMVLWDRLYCEEESWTEDSFKKLEEVGVIHRTSESLVNEIVDFKKNPSTWLENSQRRKVCSEFSAQFALTSKHWSKEWKQFLNTLN